MNEILDDDIDKALSKDNWRLSADEGRLMLLELLCKANAGYYNSHTEENFLRQFHLLNKNRTANKQGRLFICNMIYNHSNKKPEAYDLITKYRK